MRTTGFNANYSKVTGKVGSKNINRPKKYINCT